MTPEEHQMVDPISDSPTTIPQTIKVAPAETASSVDTQAIDDPVSPQFTWTTTTTTQFTWTIDNFSRLNVEKLYSEVFNVGGYEWRILIYPKGNKVNCLSMYLDVADSATLPYGWSRYAQFSLAVLNQVQNTLTVKKEIKSYHQFKAGVSDWGFKSFMSLSTLHDPRGGYLVCDKIVIEADVAMRKVQ